MSNLPKILIVDDLEPMLRLWMRQLRGVADVVCAKTLAEGEARFKEHADWALICLDGQVDGPFLDTLPLLALIRATYAGPIIATASHLDDRARQMASGCTHELEEKTQIGLLPALARQILGLDDGSTKGGTP